MKNSPHLKFICSDNMYESVDSTRYNINLKILISGTNVLVTPIVCNFNSL